MSIPTVNQICLHFTDIFLVFFMPLTQILLLPSFFPHHRRTVHQIKVCQTIMICLSCGWLVSNRPNDMRIESTITLKKKISTKFDQNHENIFLVEHIAWGNCVLSIFNAIQFYFDFITWWWNDAAIERI